MTASTNSRNAWTTRTSSGDAVGIALAAFAVGIAEVQASIAEAAVAEGPSGCSPASQRPLED